MSFLPLTTGAGFVLRGEGSTKEILGLSSQKNDNDVIEAKYKDYSVLPLFVRTGLGFCFETSSANEII